MAEWAPKRFWKEARALSVEGGYSVTLDGRPVRTPAKAPLVLPTLAMAEAIAAEWDAQSGQINPESMPCARAAHSAIDKLTLQRAAVIEMLAAYGGSDLLCYRAERPDLLVARQAQGWDPLLDWAAQTFDAPLRVTKGLMPIAQPPESLSRLAAQLAPLSPFELAAFHDLVAMSGSLVLALAVLHGRLDAPEAWRLSRIDEDYQAEAWGHDEEAAEIAALKAAAFVQADRFWKLCR